MEVHAEYFLKCNEAAKWLNTPQPVTGVPKEFLDGAHAVTSTIAGACARVSGERGSCHPTRNGEAPSRRKQPVCGPSKASSSSSSGSLKRSKRVPCSRSTVDRDVRCLERGFPSLADLGSGKPFGNKSLLYVPVELYDHFVFGVVIGRKCCLMFSYYAEGSIVVLVDCFDEVGDHFQEITFFEPTPVVGVFPRGIRGRMQIFEKRDCPKCTGACMSCSCPVNERVEAIVKMRQNRVLVPGHGPAHAGSYYKDENVTIQTYPYWSQVLDEYKWSRIGSYCVQIRYTPAAQRGVSQGKVPGPSTRTLAYRASVYAEPRVTVEKMLRVSLFDKGVSALKPPATDVRWETSSTVSVNGENKISSESDPVSAVCFTDWHKLPGFQEDYLLVAPSNIVSGAHARAELARAEAERLAARARSGVPVLPSWASGRAGVFEHILNESGPELEGLMDDFQTNRDTIQAQMIHSIPQGSVGTVMRPRSSIEKMRPRSRDRSPRVSLEDNNGRAALPTTVKDSNRRKRKEQVSPVARSPS